MLKIRGSKSGIKISNGWDIILFMLRLVNKYVGVAVPRIEKLGKHIQLVVLYTVWKTVLLYCFAGMVIAAQCTASFLKSIVLPRI